MIEEDALGLDIVSKRIVLVDGTEFSVLMVQNGVGVRTRTKHEIKTIDEDYFSE